MSQVGASAVIKNYVYYVTSILYFIINICVFNYSIENVHFMYIKIFIFENL